MARLGTGRIVLGALGAIGIVAVVRRTRRVATGRSVAGGVLMGDVGGYDLASRLLFGTLFRGIAADVAANAPSGGQVLEVGCGPGGLSIELARGHGLEVTGLDLDPRMIERATSNADRATAGGGFRPDFVVGDVAALPFAAGSFDLVVSTFSMHHWADRVTGLAEIARVLRPGGRALIWDLKPGTVPFHPPTQGPAHGSPDSPLGAAPVTPWRWPFHLTLAQRIEFTPS